MIKNIQKVVFIGSLIVSALYFIYTLCFSTPWAMGSRYGDFFDQAQIVNHAIFDLGLKTVVFAGLGLVFHSHSNRNFYIANYLFLGLTCWWMISTATQTLELVPPLAPIYEALPETLHRRVTALNGTMEPTLIMFDLAPILSYALFVTAGLMIAVAVYKTYERIMRIRAKKQQSSEVRS